MTLHDTDETALRPSTIVAGPKVEPLSRTPHMHEYRANGAPSLPARMACSPPRLAASATTAAAYFAQTFLASWRVGVDPAVVTS